MKTIIFIVSCYFMSASFAQEVATDCLAMNEVTRDKIVKIKRPKAPLSKGASAQ